MIRLIATDLDGTLLEKGGALPEGFYEVADGLKKLGILLVASSGRQYDNLRRKFQPIAREMGFVCENGGLNALGREIVSIHPMDRATVLAIIQTLQGMGLSVLLSGVRCCYTWSGDRSFCDEMVYGLRNTMTIVDDFSQVDDDFIKLAAYHPGTIAPFVDKLQQKWGAAVNVARSGMEWCDFNLSNKGMGLKDLMRRLNLSPSEAAAFGDNYNDESMLCEVGHPFLMESADAGLWKPGIRKCRHVLDVWRAIILHGGELPEDEF